MSLRNILSFPFLLAASNAFGQWTVTILHPPAFLSVEQSSAANATGRAQQAGVTWPGNAALWSRSAGTLVNLHPAGFSDSECLATDGLQQGGWVRISGSEPRRAALWSGSASSFVLLHSGGLLSSEIRGVRGGQQVGQVDTGTRVTAGLWTGSSASLISLEPAGSTASSVANGTDGIFQVGSRVAGGVGRATMWAGTPESMTNLHPSSAQGSVAHAVDSGQQCGEIFPFGQAPRPALWSGTATSVVDLTPPGSDSGAAMAISNGIQVGHTRSPGVNFDRAALWHGSAATHINLHSFLPSGYARESRATGVWVDGNSIAVVGIAITNPFGRSEAVLWRTPAVPTAVGGIIGLNDVVWNPNSPRNITVTVSQGANVLATRGVAVGTTAAFQMNVPGAGEAVVTVDGPTQLSRRRNIFLDGNPINLGAVILLNGDVDGSGEVDAADIDGVITQFGAAFSLADVDLSGEVDAADIDIVIANFGGIDE